MLFSSSAAAGLLATCGIFCPSLATPLATGASDTAAHALAVRQTVPAPNSTPLASLVTWPNGDCSGQSSRANLTSNSCQPLSAPGLEITFLKAGCRCMWDAGL